MTTTMPFLAFATDAADLEALRRFATARGWTDNAVLTGNIKDAAEFLKNNSSPGVLLVEIPSQAEAAALLDALSEVCAPETKVIVTGSVNEYSFYCWLTDIGISSYLLRPLAEPALEKAFVKATSSGGTVVAQVKTPGKVIAVMGSRGGVGGTTLAINLAGIIAEFGEKNTALVDIDPQKGSIALALDIEPSKGFREALERPDRLDSLFLERAMHKHGKHLFVLDSEETLHDRFTIHDSAADVLLKELQDNYQVIILDLPRHLNAYTRKCLAHADEVVIVTELTLSGLRDTLRLGDMLRLNYDAVPSVVVANRVGMANKHAVKDADFEKGINDKIAYKVPFAPDIYMPIGPDIAAVKSKGHSAVKPLYELAARLLPGLTIQKGKAAAAPDKSETKGGGFFKRAPKQAKEE